MLTVVLVLLVAGAVAIVLVPASASPWIQRATNGSMAVGVGLIAALALGQCLAGAPL